MAQPANLQQELYDCLDEVQKRKPWLTDKSPEPWAALVMSDNTRNFYGRAAGLVEDRYMAAVFGAFRAMVEAHLPVAASTNQAMAVRFVDFLGSPQARAVLTKYGFGNP